MPGAGLTGGFPERDNFTLIHHVLPNVTERTKIGAIPQDVKAACVRDYTAILDENPDLNLLFIDHVSGLAPAQFARCSGASTSSSITMPRTGATATTFLRSRTLAAISTLSSKVSCPTRAS